MKKLMSTLLAIVTIFTFIATPSVSVKAVTPPPLKMEPVPTYRTTVQKVLVSDYYKDGTKYYGPSKRGPGTLILERVKSTQDQVTATIGGTYRASDIFKINASLGVSIGHVDSFSVSDTIIVEAGKTKQSIIMPVFHRYKVTVNEYMKYPGTIEQKVATRVSYVNVFSNFEYSWRYI